MGMFKLKFKSFCLQYTSNRSKNKKNKIQKLILELNKTEQQLASEPQNRELQRKTLHLKKTTRTARNEASTRSAG